MRAFNTGFSLVELLLALALGSVLLLGTLKIYRSSQQHFAIQTALARLDENIQASRYIFTYALQNAGFRTSPPQSFKQAFPDGIFSTQRELKDTNYLAHSDSLRVRYQSDGYMKDCLGHQQDAGQDAYFELYIDKENTLKCLTLNNQGTRKNVPQPLIDHIAHMQVTYGLASQAPHQKIDAYSRRISAEESHLVRMVEIKLVVASPPLLPPKEHAPLITLDDGQSLAAADLIKKQPNRRLYKTAEFWIPIANLKSQP